jgi:hypothetical protein
MTVQSPTNMTANAAINYGQNPTSGGGQQYTGSYDYLIPGAQALGDVAMLAMQKQYKPQQINAPAITPRMINLAPQRAQIQSNMMNQQRSNQMMARNAGMNPTQYMSSVGAANSDVQRGTNEALLQSGMAEQQANAGTYNQFANINAQRGMQANMYNQQMRNSYNQQRLGIMNNMASIPAQSMQSAQNIRNYELASQAETPSYNYYNSPNANFWQKMTGSTPVQMRAKRFGGMLKKLYK